MKKIMVMLLAIAATANVMAVDYTAKAKLTLASEAGYTFNLMLSESAEYSADITGSPIYNLDENKVALYVISGNQKLQTARSSSLDGAQLGFKADESTNYTITVSSVAGSETLYLLDGADNAYALEEGAVISFEADASSEARFTLVKQVPPGPTEKGICFNYEKLQLNLYNGATVNVYLKGEEQPAKTQEIEADVDEMDLSELAKGQYKVVITIPGAAKPEEYIIDIKPELTPAN